MELQTDSTSIPSEGFFQDGEGIEMSQSVLQKLQEMKELNHKEELKKQKCDLPLHRYIKPRTYLERYETSLLEDLSFIDPRKTIMKPNSKPLPSRYFNHSGDNDNDDDEEEENLERLNTVNEQASIESVGFSSDDDDDDKENKEAISAVGNDYDEDDEEIENSFEKSSSSAINLDNMPVTNIVQGGKTFEEVIEEQLLKEQQRKDELSLVNKVPTPKKSFLRKGQGTARFNGPPIKVTSRKPAKKDGKTVKIGAPKPELKLKLERKEKVVRPVEEKIVKPVEEKTLPAMTNNVIPTNKPPIRKTARLRREPIKKLNLLPLQTSTKANNEPSVGRPPVIQRSLAPSPAFDQPKYVVHSHEKEREITTPVSPAQEEKEPTGNDYNDEEEWSDPNDDTVLTLETTELENLLKVPSDPDQTSNETFERIERYCNDNFDDDDMASFDLDDTIKLRRDVQGAVEANNMQQQATVSAEEPSNLLMQKLFPSLKPPPPPAITRKQVEKKPFQPEYYADPDQPKPESGTILKSKLEELQAEIKRFQKENEAMVKSRAEHEHGVEELRKQVEDFQKLKNEELVNIEQYRKSERGKLKKDRRMFEDYVNTTKKNLPSKEDKETILELQEELEQARSEAKLKEQRLAAVNSRLRTQVEMLSSENTELKNQLQSFEERNTNLEKEAQRRKAKESNQMWKEINEIVDNSTSFNLPSKVEIVECNLPVARYITSPPDSPSPKTSRKSTREPPRKDIVAAPTVRCVSHDKKRETQLEDGSTEIIYYNDTRKVVSADGKTVEVTFSNGDVRTTLPGGAETYFYKASGARRTTQADGVQVIEFDNEQIERHFIDGSKHITFPDGSSKLIRQDGYEETTLQDGTCMHVHPSGEKTIDFPNGQREIHTGDFKRREYPDGTSKTVFSDGRQETKYASGRLRVKDPNGRVVIDSMLPPQTSTANQAR